MQGQLAHVAHTGRFDILGAMQRKEEAAMEKTQRVGSSFPGNRTYCPDPAVDMTQILALSGCIRIYLSLVSLLLQEETKRAELANIASKR